METNNKQEKQLKKFKNQTKKKEIIKRDEKRKKAGKIVLLGDNLDKILLEYGMNVAEEGEDILKKIAKN